MKDWKKVAVKPDATIKEVVDIIDRYALQIALVVDSEETLLGTVTDGDVRRGLLRGISIDLPVSEIYNSAPYTLNISTPEKRVFEIMKRNYIKQIPIVDDEGKVISLEALKEVMTKQKKKNFVVIMAGGLGSRLRPLTNDCPKPLLKVSGKPILEIIIEKFINEGFENFYLSVNYKADMIENYFGDGSKWGVNIQYLKEDKKLGTAGGLSLIERDVDMPVIVMNGDLLTKVDFNRLLDFHSETDAAATMCVREYEMKIPYGVVNVENTSLKSIDEKPSHKFFVNAGIYVLSPDTINRVQDSRYLDMPDFFSELIDKGYQTSAFPVQEYWIDIGRIKDFETANFEYGQMFLLQ